MAMHFFKKSILLFLFLGLYICYPLSAKIVQLDDIKYFKQEAGPLDKNSLVLFDIDYTLIVPKDVVLGPRGKKFSHKLIAEILENPDFVPPGKYPDGFLFGKVLTTAQFVPVDSRSTTIIRELQNENIPTLALTAAEARKLGEMESFANFRINQLMEMGFDFSNTFPRIEFLKFTKSDDKEFHPIFKSGILFASKHPKGEVLKQFLEALHLSPKKVVFVDDRMEYLQSVEKTMSEKGIEFIGLYYTAAEKLSGELDKKLGEFQFRYLAEQGEWLGDEDAKVYLAKVNP